jgi:hypothetical protein
LHGQLSLYQMLREMFNVATWDKITFLLAVHTGHIEFLQWL